MSLKFETTMYMYLNSASNADITKAHLLGRKTKPDFKIGILSGWAPRRYLGALGGLVCLPKTFLYKL
jgi:hypothetical protein